MNKRKMLREKIKKDYGLTEEQVTLVFIAEMMLSSDWDGATVTLQDEGLDLTYDDVGKIFTKIYWSRGV